MESISIQQLMEAVGAQRLDQGWYFFTASF